MVYMMSNTSKQFRHGKVSFLILFAGLILLTGCGKLGDGRENENAETRAPSLVLTSYISEDSILTCEYELTAPQDATYLQINVEQYSNGESDCLFTGGVSIGEDRVPISQLSGSITMTAADNDPLSLIIDILDSCGIRYEIPIDALDTIFTSKVMTTPISPTINETIRLVELIPNDFDISESISVEIIFGDQDDAFSLLGNA